MPYIQLQIRSIYIIEGLIEFSFFIFILGCRDNDKWFSIFLLTLWLPLLASDYNNTPSPKRDFKWLFCGYKNQWLRTEIENYIVFFFLFVVILGVMKTQNRKLLSLLIFSPPLYFKNNNILLQFSTPKNNSKINSKWLWWVFLG